MNEFLADLYGTRETIGASNSEDVQKLAEAQILDQFFTAEGINVDQLPNETIVKVAQQLFGEESAIAKMAAPAPAPTEKVAESVEEEAKREGETVEEEKKEHEETAEEKTAEADYLGRVMAHAFVQERAIIEKEAGVKDFAKKVLEGVKSAPKKAGEAVKDVPASFHRGKSEHLEHLTHASDKPKFLKTRAAAHGVGHAIKEHPAVTGAAAAAAGGAAFGGKKLFGKKDDGHKKAASALDMLAEQRAIEILKEAGIEPQPAAEPTEEQKLAAAVEARAYEMLTEAGFVQE
jgi:hypothetical protein